MSLFKPKNKKAAPVVSEPEETAAEPSFGWEKLDFDAIQRSSQTDFDEKTSVEDVLREIKQKQRETQLFKQAEPLENPFEVVIKPLEPEPEPPAPEPLASGEQGDSRQLFSKEQSIEDSAAAEQEPPTEPPDDDTPQKKKERAEKNPKQSKEKPKKEKPAREKPEGQKRSGIVLFTPEMTSRRRRYMTSHLISAISFLSISVLASLALCFFFYSSELFSMPITILLVVLSALFAAACVFIFVRYLKSLNYEYETQYTD